MRELGVEQIEAHVAAVCLARGTRPLRVLALHRAPTRALFPGLWEGPGGQVRTGEGFEDAVARHVSEEAGIRCDVWRPVSTYVIEPGAATGAETRIPGVRFLVIVDGMPTVSIDLRQHQDWRWVPVTQLDRVGWIPGVLSQIEEALAEYRQASGFDEG